VCLRAASDTWGTIEKTLRSHKLLAPNTLPVFSPKLRQESLLEEGEGEGEGEGEKSHYQDVP